MISISLLLREGLFAIRHPEEQPLSTWRPPEPSAGPAAAPPPARAPAPPSALQRQVADQVARAVAADLAANGSLYRKEIPKVTTPTTPTADTLAQEIATSAAIAEGRQEPPPVATETEALAAQIIASASLADGEASE